MINAVIVWGENWHEGVIGIVASNFQNIKPAFIFLFIMELQRSVQELMLT